MNENLPERILYLALEKVSYDEDRVYLLLSKLIQPDTQVSPHSHPYPYPHPHPYPYPYPHPYPHPNDDYFIARSL